jgi:hypothetical protein
MLTKKSKIRPFPRETSNSSDVTVSNHTNDSTFTILKITLLFSQLAIPTRSITLILMKRRYIMAKTPTVLAPSLYIPLGSTLL